MLLALPMCLGVAEGKVLRRYDSVVSYQVAYSFVRAGLAAE